MTCRVSESMVRNKIREDFTPYFEAMIDAMVDNYREKGDSWKKLPWSYLMHKLSVQFEDMENRDDEDFYANIGNYGVMLWLNTKSGLYESLSSECDYNQEGYCIVNKLYKEYEVCEHMGSDGSCLAKDEDLITEEEYNTIHRTKTGETE